MDTIIRATTLAPTSPLHTSNPTSAYSVITSIQQLRPLSVSQLSIHGSRQRNGKRGGSVGTANALPDLPLMAVLVQHMEGQRDLITHKSIWHLSDEAIKNVYLMYAMFTCWGCCFFGSTKDPYYDSESYREDGGDGTGHWIYEKQENIEETARQELLREELIEEIELKVGGLRELGEAAEREEELVK